MDSALEVERLSVDFAGHRALDIVSFTLPPGQLVGLLGPNGAGKSTLFRAILGQVEHTGTVRVSGEIPSYVPQGDTVAADFPATAADVATMGRFGHRRWWQRLSRDDHAAATAALETVGMAEHAGCTFATLSGGQRQRVMLARALAHDKQVILLDEPMTGVDSVSRDAIAATIARLRDDGRTVLMSTHDLSDAARSCDRLIFLNRRIIHDGPPATTFTPEVIQAAYEGAAVMLTRPDGGSFGVLDDAHHHDHGSVHGHSHAPSHEEHHHP